MMHTLHPFRIVAVTSLACILCSSGTGEAVLATSTAATLAPATRTAAPAPVRAEEPEDLRLPLVLTALNRPNDRLEVQPYDRHGRLIPEAHDAISYFLRCQKTGRVRPIHPGTVALLYQISRDYPGRDIVVVSGFRSREARAKGQGSPHWRARAVDLRINGVPPEKLSRQLWKTYDGIAVGYYPTSRFVHVDVRDVPVRWVERGGVNQYETHARAELRALKPVPSEFPLQPPATTGTAVALATQPR